jgi:transcription termination/antitermination protein NusA
MSAQPQMNQLHQMIEAVARDKGIDTDIIVTALEEAYLAAARRVFKDEENLKTKLNPETGEIDVFAVKTIVDEVTNPATEYSLAEARELYGDEAETGMEIEFPKDKEKLGRIAAQTAKQVIFQKVREAERENVFAEYSQRIGEVLGGVVKRFENGDIIIELGRGEAQLPRKEQSRAENYSIADRVRAVIKMVNKNAKGPQVVLSRTDPSLLIKLFEQEVPEIYDGTVMIRGAVREAGDRAKVAVYSRDRDVDPVGACVGMKGTRVQAIIRELRGEKIDIVEFSDDPVQFVMHAISPARVQRVTIVDDAERVMEVVVEDKQLSLAIGKKGQNVRLAAKLTGWKIDIKSEEEKRREVEAHFAELDFGGSRWLNLPGVDDEIVEALRAAGFQSNERILAASAEELAAVEGVGEETAARVLDVAREATAAGQAAHDERVEAERIEAERVEAERLEAEKVENERLEAERLEAERVQAEADAETARAAADAADAADETAAAVDDEKPAVEAEEDAAKATE